MDCFVATLLAMTIFGDTMQHLMAAMMAGSMMLYSGGAKAAEANMTIAVFTKNTTNPAYESFRIAADQIARSTGVRTLHYVPKQPDNIGEQQAMVEQVLKDRPDAVIFTPVDDVAMIGSVQKLNAAKIPIILVTNPLPGSFVTYIGADDFDIGYRQARHLFDTLEGKGKIVVIEGLPAAPTNRERVRGYQRAYAEFPGIEVLGSGIGNYQQPDGKRVMEKFLREHAQIDAVLSANDGMALGALEALKEANRASVVIGINGILPAIKAIESGALLASVDFNMFKIGCIATRAAVRHLKGEPLPEKILLPAEIIDQTNYKAWLTPVDQRSCPEWNEVVN
jgi:ribose transport system substrate-binding protein